ncbi:MAG: hypothetical protein CL661_00575 [Bacteroidetes bacterium]|jgi:4-amino-4-deoxy-L-arabinose transferase-like glycosyltransferase|nr:hypothetical protein [Bacteroidota bacterium]
MHFFEPRILNLNSVDGKAVGEFPILYYLTALLYKIFGEHEFFLRLINLSIITTGLLFLYKLLIKLLDDIAYALIFTFLFFSSAILIYYTNNYLPDPAALGFTLIAWYFYYEFLVKRNKTKAFIISLIFFTLASLIKVSYGLNPAAALLSLIIIKVIGNQKYSIKKNYPYLLSFLFSFLIIIGWYLFIIKYNETNNGNYFLTHYQPIWSLKKVQIDEVWNYMYYYWLPNYYYESTLHVFGWMIIIGLIFIKTSNKIILTIATSTFIGSSIYFVLFFLQFKEHDYYFLALIPGIIFLVINAFISIRNRFPIIFGNLIFKLALLLLLILSLNYANKKVSGRYSIKNDKFANIGTQLDNANEYIINIGISKDSKLIVVQDYTPNGSLYFLNRTGWTISDTAAIELIRIHTYIQKGASYLVLTDKNYLKNSTIRSLAKNVVGEYNGAVFYSLNK